MCDAAQVDEKAVQTPFPDNGQLQISFPEAQCPSRSALPNLDDFTQSVTMPAVASIIPSKPLIA